MTWSDVLGVWGVPAAIGAMLGLMLMVIGWNSRDRDAKIWGARVFFLSPIWPVVVLSLLPWIWKTAQWKGLTK